MKPKLYRFKWNGKETYISAFTYSSARRKFNKIHGFFPDEEKVLISLVAA